MLLAIAFVVVALWMKVRWSTCLWMVLGGVGIYGASELICLGILKSILKGRQWAIDLVVWILWPLAPIAIAIYAAGIFTLLIKGLIAGYAALFG